jgi:thioredoxin 1
MASNTIVTITEGNFQAEVLQSKTPVLVDFWAPWCGPCKMIAPILDELAGEYDGRVKIAKINTDEQQELAAQFRVSSIPTLLLFREGQVVEQMVGAKSKRELKASFDRLAA